MLDLPSGTITFFFTGIEGSTRLWERDRQVIAVAVDRHLVLLDTAIASHSGIRSKTVGDAVQAAFPTAPDAVSTALNAQRKLCSESWLESVRPVRMRIALHTTAAMLTPRRRLPSQPHRSRVRPSVPLRAESIQFTAAGAGEPVGACH